MKSVKPRAHKVIYPAYTPLHNVTNVACDKYNVVYKKKSGVF